MADDAAYPKRPQHFAFQFLKKLRECRVANEIGPTACHLLTTVVLAEDDVWYRRPVQFYNDQLMMQAGIGSEPALIRARDRCVEAGWLCYVPGGNRRPGTYHVVDREEVSSAPGEASGVTSSTPHFVSRSVSRGGAESCVDPCAEAEAMGSTNSLTPEIVSRNVSPPLPNPNPISAGSAPAAATPATIPSSTSNTAPRKRGRKGDSAPRSPRPRNPLFDALVEVTASNPTLNGGHLGKVAAALARASPPYTADDVREFGRRFLELCPWAVGERDRPTRGEVEQHISRLRAGPGLVIPAPARQSRFETQDERNVRMLLDGISPEDP